MMDNPFFVTGVFLFGFVVGIVLAFDCGHVAIISGEKAGYLITEYHDNVYRLVPIRDEGK